jgi:hypothetical protein
MLLERTPMVDSHLPALPEIVATVPIGDPAENLVAVYSTTCCGGLAARSEGAGEDG